MKFAVDVMFQAIQTQQPYRILNSNIIFSHVTKWTMEIAIVAVSTVHNSNAFLDALLMITVVIGNTNATDTDHVYCESIKFVKCFVCFAMSGRKHNGALRR